MNWKYRLCMLAVAALCTGGALADDGAAVLRAPTASFSTTAQQAPNAAAPGTTMGDRQSLYCPANTLYGQDPEQTNWSAGVSDQRDGPGGAYGPLTRYDNYSNLEGTVCDLHWWGMILQFNPWVNCEENPMVFEIKFYDGSGSGCCGEGTVVWQDTVTVLGVPVADFSGYTVYEFSVVFEPCLDLPPDGWLSIKGISVADPNCWFLWLNSYAGDGTSWMCDEDLNECTNETWDLAFCLTGEPGPPQPGACCLEHVSGTPWCQVMFEEECLALGGIYMGDGTDCGYALDDYRHYESTPNAPIPDYPYGPVEDEILPDESCEVGDVKVDVCIHHPRIRDLRITLEHWGRVVVLWDGACGDNDSLGVIFDDYGNAVICGTSTVGNIDPVSTGGGPLAAFFGMEVNGPWVLRVRDVAAGPDEGRPPVLIHWSLHIAFLEYNPCVEPRGACCLNETYCEIMTCEDCYFNGGTYLGDFTTCDSDVCPCMPEGEPDCGDEYVDTFNGGCNSVPPVFSPINCGDRICGTGGNYLYQGEGYRDTDWYEIWVDEITEITWTVQGMAPSQAAIIQPGPGSDPCVDFVVLANATSAECDPVTVSATVSPGNYWLFTAVAAFSGWSCPMEYVCKVDCRRAGACCLPDGGCLMLTAEACFTQHGRWQGPLVACDDVPYPCLPIGACCLEEPVGPEGTIWCQMLTQEECLAAPGEWLPDLTCGYPGDEVHSWFASPYLEIPDNDPAGISHTIWVDESCEVGDVDIDVVIHHTYLADLLITVEHYGVVVVLWDSACGSNDHMSVMFDDEGNAVLCVSPVVGSITPRSANGGWLSAFNGLEVSGPWTITVVDQVGLDVGWLYHWSVHIRFLMENPCEPYPRGACCFTDGSCDVMHEDECLSLGATYMGDYVLCVPNPCPQAAGACCFIDGHCEELPQDACTEAGGVEWIAGETCTPDNPCPQFDFWLNSAFPPGGGTGWDGQWYYYEQGQWWNMWWPNEFSLVRQKVIIVRFWVGGGAPVDVALNWSTAPWPEDPARPPLPGDDAFIERMSLGTYDPGGLYVETRTLEFCPRWVSMDARSQDPFVIWGFIDHTCLPGPEVAICCHGYMCYDVDPNDPTDPHNEEACLAQGGEYYPDRTCAEDPYPCDCGGVDYRGDSNCLGDGANSYDIDHFILAVGAPDAWIATHSCNFYCANDINCDDAVDAYDIDGFVTCIATVCPPCGP